jgi:arylsulfatase A-like enzyme
VLFTDNRSQASCTFPSVNSLLTSRYGQRFWGRPFGQMGIPDSELTLAEILAARGYATAAVSASPVVRKTPSWANKEGGFEDGFATFHEGCAEVSEAGCINREAIGLLQRLDRPFFLYLHYMDTHGPYRPPEEWQLQFAGGRPPAKRWVRLGDVGPLSRMIYDGGPDVHLTPEDLAHMIALYDDELAYFDFRFGELMAELRRLDLLDNTIVVFVSDHGESFLEHEDFTHCRSLYDSEIKVPLIMHLPSLRRPVRVEQATANLDVVPTILDYLGDDLAAYPFEGRSLRPAIERGQPVRDYVFSSVRVLRTVSDGRHKLIRNLVGGDKAVSLFDLASDPGEHRNLIDRDRRTYHELDHQLEGWLATVEGNARSEENLQRSEDSITQLKALGYL